MYTFGSSKLPVSSNGCTFFPTTPRDGRVVANTANLPDWVSPLSRARAGVVPGSNVVASELHESCAAKLSEGPFVGITPKWRSNQSPMGAPVAFQHLINSRSLAVLSQMQLNDERYNEIPPEYGSALPLDVYQTTRSIPGSFGYPTVLYKVVDRRSGVAYTMRRVDGARASNKAIAVLSESFTTHRRLHEPFKPGGGTFITQGLCLCDVRLPWQEQHSSCTISYHVQRPCMSTTSYHPTILVQTSWCMSKTVHTPHRYHNP
mmetsp:Transcript_27289/g.109300  ORF Transcript_27289/g.109300 Transcript_27289/m.109300 type:complete len:261 (+) Transcript_27289:91-873(+)